MYGIVITMGKMKNTPVFAIDFEGSAKIGIVEYGVAEIFGGEIVGARTRVCSPKSKIGRRDAEFFGISDAEAKTQKPFADDIAEFCRFRARGVFLAHNAVVEDSFLRAELPSPGVVPDFARGGQTPDWAPWLDTCVLVRSLFPQLGGAKLSDCVAKFSLGDRLADAAEKFCPPDRRKWHCALYDALASALILLRICEFDGMEDVDIAWLAKYSGVADSGQERLF